MLTGLYILCYYIARQQEMRQKREYGSVAQLVRAPACHAGGRGFEPLLSRHFGSLAQLGERLPYKQDVTGSSPVIPINKNDVHFEHRFFILYSFCISQKL